MTGRRENKNLQCASCGKIVQELLKCRVCGKAFCENCIVDVAGNDVCAECKETALNRLRDGVSVECVENKIFPVRAIFTEPARLERPGVSKSFWGYRHHSFGILLGFMSFPIIGYAIYTSDICPAIIGVVFLSLGIVSFRRIYRKPGRASKIIPEAIEVGENKIIKEFSYRGPEVVNWDEVKEVILYTRKSIDDYEGIMILTDKEKFWISRNYEPFEELLKTVRQICRERNIEVTEK